MLLSGVGASAEALNRFKREARASARIKSDHVVRVIDADVAPELDGAPFLVMELLEGSDLERKAAAERPTPGTVVDWLRQVAVAIDKAHRLGIVHRDLKPENLFLTSRENGTPIVKVLDFGIVKMTEEGTGATGSGQILGTPQYMAPEQVSTGARITPATDRYALGLVAYRLLTGESYYQGDVMKILAQLLHEPLQRPSQRHAELGTAIDSWFARACHRSPEERFASAAEQVEALSAALGLPTLAVDPSSGIRAAALTGPTPRRRSTPRLALGLAAVVAAGAVAAVVISRRPGAGGSGGAVSSKPLASPATSPSPPPSPSPRPRRPSRRPPRLFRLPRSPLDRHTRQRAIGARFQARFVSRAARTASVRREGDVVDRADGGHGQDRRGRSVRRPEVARGPALPVNAGGRHG